MGINEQNFVFGSTVRRLRKESKKTQNELANYLNMTLRGYQDIESGKSGTSLTRLIDLADFFNCSVDYLLGHQINDPTRQKEATMLQRQLCNDILALDEDDCGRVEAYIAGIKAKNKETEKLKKSVLNENVDW